MEKRLFIGLSVEAPWPHSYPKGRVLEESGRHITLAFLGNGKILDLKSFPKPHFQLGQAALASSVVFLPKFKPRVVAYQIDWVSGEKEVIAYRQELYKWLEPQGYSLDKRPFDPHLTMARSPFVEREWEAHFQPLPLVVTGIHLYESIGSLRYPTIFSVPLTPIFEEFEHTADIAFHIRGRNCQELYDHAALAMSFEFPLFLQYRKEVTPSTLDEVVKFLNQMVSACDRDHGCPFKAVSYHGKLHEENEWMNWEMVIDV